MNVCQLQEYTDKEIVHNLYLQLSQRIYTSQRISKFITSTDCNTKNRLIIECIFSVSKIFMWCIHSNSLRKPKIVFDK